MSKSTAESPSSGRFRGLVPGRACRPSHGGRRGTVCHACSAIRESSGRDGADAAQDAVTCDGSCPGRGGCSCNSEGISGTWWPPLHTTACLPSRDVRAPCTVRPLLQLGRPSAPPPRPPPVLTTCPSPSPSWSLGQDVQEDGALCPVALPPMLCCFLHRGALPQQDPAETPESRSWSAQVPMLPSWVRWLVGAGGHQRMASWHRELESTVLSPRPGPEAGGPSSSLPVTISPRRCSLRNP